MALALQKSETTKRDIGLQESSLPATHSHPGRRRLMNGLKMVCRVWGVSVVGVLALTLSNIFLTLRMLHNKEEPLACGGVSSPRGWTLALHEANLTQYLSFLRKSKIVTDVAATNKQTGCESDLPDNNSSNLPAVFVIDEQLGRYDFRRLHKTHEHVYVGPSYRMLASNAILCLATQTSVDRLYWLVQAARHWKEPISVAVFTPDVEYGIARIYLQYLTTCFPFLGEKITVHFTYPVAHPPLPLSIKIQDLLNLCDQPVTVLRQLLKKRDKQMLSWRERMLYPQNLLRNVARKTCGAEWVYLVDVDIVAVPHMSRKLTEFLRTNTARKCDKCAFVIPTYEVDEKSPLPGNRTDLLKLVKKGRARPFHKKVFVHNQHATNFSLWESLEGSKAQSSNDDPVFVSHVVSNFEFFYEPFYIARDTVPAHDERFVGYGFTRNTQVYEMFVMGYKFLVLTPLFTLHWGMQGKKGRPQWREKQNNNNRKLFEGFKKEVYGRYQRDPLGMMKPKKKSTKKRAKTTKARTPRKDDSILDLFAPMPL